MTSPGTAKCFRPMSAIFSILSKSPWLQAISERIRNSGPVREANRMRSRTGALHRAPSSLARIVANPAQRAEQIERWRAHGGRAARTGKRGLQMSASLAAHPRLCQKVQSVSTIRKRIWLASGGWLRRQPCQRRSQFWQLGLDPGYRRTPVVSPTSLEGKASAIPSIARHARARPPRARLPASCSSPNSRMVSSNSNRSTPDPVRTWRTRFCRQASRIRQAERSRAAPETAGDHPPGSRSGPRGQHPERKR